jgi:hypothetical protein
MALSFVAVWQGEHPRLGSTVLAVLMMATTGCMETRECTAIGCTDQLGVELRTATGAWADGLYELTVRADDQLAGSCTLRIPEQLPEPPGQVVSMPCGNGARFELSHQSQCEMGCDGNACWQKCTPIPGKFQSRLAIQGTPARFELTLLRDGETILAQKVEPAYGDVYPNGPECGGACRQATLEYAVP